VLLLSYNYLQTGDPLLQPFTKFNPHDRLGLTDGSLGYGWGVTCNLLGRMSDVNAWIPLSAVILMIFPWQVLPRKSAGEILPAAFVAALVAASFFSLFHPGNQYGPRYLYESAFAILLVMGLSLGRLPGSAAPLIVLLIVGLNAAQFCSYTRRFAGEVADRMQLYDRVGEQNLSNAIV